MYKKRKLLCNHVSSRHHIFHWNTRTYV